MSDRKVYPLIGGWSFSESSRCNGVSHYILMSPTGIAGSEEYHENEIKDVIISRNLYDELIDSVENLLIGIGMGWDLDGMIESTQEAIVALKKNEKLSVTVLTS